MASGVRFPQEFIPLASSGVLAAMTDASPSAFMSRFGGSIEGCIAMDQANLADLSGHLEVWVLGGTAWLTASQSGLRRLARVLEAGRDVAMPMAIPPGTKKPSYGRTLLRTDMPAVGSGGPRPKPAQRSPVPRGIDPRAIARHAGAIADSPDPSSEGPSRLERPCWRRLRMASRRRSTHRQENSV